MSNKFIDFDDENEMFYDNIYLNDYKLVVKIPMAGKSNVDVKIEKTKKEQDIKVEKFDLTKYTYLLCYDEDR